MEFTCADWEKLKVIEVLGHGHYREARLAKYGDRDVVLKVPFGGWSDPVSRKIHLFKIEVVRLLRMQHPSLPHVYGYCLAESLPDRIGVVVELLVPWSKVVHSSSLSWRKSFSTVLLIYRSFFAFCLLLSSFGCR